MSSSDRIFHAKSIRLLFRAVIMLAIGIWGLVVSLSVGLSSSFSSPIDKTGGLYGYQPAYYYLVAGVILIVVGGFFGLEMITRSAFVSVGPGGLRSAPMMRAPVPWSKIAEIERIQSRLRYWRKGSLLVTVPDLSDISFANGLMGYLFWNRGGQGKIAIYPSSFQEGDEIARQIALYHPIVSRQILWRKA